MSTDKIDDLRTHLFDTLRDLRAGNMDIDKAKTICEVSKQITETAKVEVDYLRATEQTQGTGFIPDDRRMPGGGGKMRMINGGSDE
ncbi:MULTISPECIES: hypothetical protein [unclassified Thioalkalivibrio]|uniref:hypothetical protein n=1 Tax=unclassified Thioalkalivibrio TaxID=2621013 RepID=UPI000364BF99|nr:MULTISPECIES: hypothetical protein [unclassified Thioalkalivibrio]